MAVEPCELQGARVLDRDRGDRAEVVAVAGDSIGVDAHACLRYEESEHVERVHFLELALNIGERYERLD